MTETTLTPEWVTISHLGLKVKGIVKNVMDGNARVLTSMGIITVKYSELTPEPEYANPELFQKLLTSNGAWVLAAK